MRANRGRVFDERAADRAALLKSLEALRGEAARLGMLVTFRAIDAAVYEADLETKRLNEVGL